MDSITAEETAELGHKYLKAICHRSYFLHGWDGKRDAHFEHEAFTVVTYIQDAIRGHFRPYLAERWGDTALEIRINLAEVECCKGCIELRDMLLL